MKKFYSFLFAAVALVGFAACSSDSTEEPAPESFEKVSFKANIDFTKTGLDAENKTTWVAGDKVVINYNDVDYIFVCGEDLATFTCEQTGVTALVGKEHKAVYSNNADGKIDSNAGVAGAVLEATGTLTNENATFDFAVTSAFLKFTTTGAVTLKGAGLFSTGDTFEVTEAVTDKYVAVNPAADVDFSVSSYGATIKSKTLTFEVKKIYNLGEFTPYNLFIEDNSGYATMAVYAYGDGEILGTWPGTVATTLDTPVEVDGKTYDKVIALSDKAAVGETYKFILNNNAMGSQYADFAPGTLTADKGDFYTTANPKTLVYIKKAGRVSNWTANGGKIACFMWIDDTNNNKKWPGVEVSTNEYNIYGNNERYYCYDAGENKNFKYLIINNNNNGEQTVDLTLEEKYIGKTVHVEVSSEKDNNKYKIAYVW